jgi:hypothetical protein
MENYPKDIEDRQGKRIAATLGIVALFLVIGMAISSAVYSVPANEPREGAYLQIDEVFFVLGASGKDVVTIEVSAFISNSGSQDAKNVEIIAFVIEKNSNLALDKTTYTVGPIIKDKTKMADFALSMPDNDSYTIKLILMEDGKISVRGSGNVNLDYHSGGTGTRFSSDPGTRGTKEDSESAMGGLAGAGNTIPVWILLGGFLALILLVASVRSSRSRKSSKDLSTEDVYTDIEEDQDISNMENGPTQLNAQILEKHSDPPDNHGFQTIDEHARSDPQNPV